MKMRIDKWLWAVRIYKTRTQATRACKEGKVRRKDERVKPAQEIEEGDIIIAQKNGINYELEVVTLIKKRVGAPIAQKCYIDHTTEEERNKYKSWYIGKGQTEKREKGKGRPTKKERREIDEYKRQMSEWDTDNSID